MANLKVHVNRSLKKIYVLPEATAAPAGTVEAGVFVHDPDIHAGNDRLESSENHVIFHHVQEILGKRSDKNPAQPALFPGNITDLNAYQILTSV